MRGSRGHATLAVVCLLAGCASEVPLVPGTEVARYDVGGGTSFVLVSRTHVEPQGTWEHRALYALDGRAIIPFALSSRLEVVVTEPPHTFWLEPATWSQHNHFDGVWRRLTPDGPSEPLPFTDAQPIMTPDGARHRVLGPRVLALCGPDLDVERAYLRFDHVEKAEESGGAGEYFVVHCRWADPDGAERVATTVVSGLLQPVSPPGGAVCYRGYGGGFPRQSVVWRGDDGWQLLHEGLRRLRPPARALVPVADPRPGGYVLGYLAEWDGEDGAPVRRLLDEEGMVRCDGIRAARVMTVDNGAYDGPRPDRLPWWEDGRHALAGGQFDWTPEYGVWLVERGDRTFEVRWPDDRWATVATGATASEAMVAAERAVTARVRAQRDRTDQNQATLAAQERREREDHAREEAARRRHEAALATWRADQDAAWARARAEIEQSRQALEAWSRSWEEKGSTPFYSSPSGPAPGADAAHRARLAETEAKTRDILRDVERNR